MQKKIIKKIKYRLYHPIFTGLLCVALATGVISSIAIEASTMVLGFVVGSLLFSIVFASLLISDSELVTTSGFSVTTTHSILTVASLLVTATTVSVVFFGFSNDILTSNGLLAGFLLNILLYDVLAHL